MALVTIENTWLSLIKKSIGYPDIDNLLLGDDEIKDLCIFPMLQKYFTKFPIQVEYSQSINGEQEIDFPDDFTFGVVDARVVDVGLVGGVGGSFWDVLAYNNMSSNYISSKTAGAYGVRGYNPSGLMHQRDTQRQLYKSKQNQYTTLKTRVDQVNKKLIAYSSITGTLNIVWAKYSNDFSSVDFEKREDVIKLCQSELMMHLANSSALLSDSSLDVTINTDYLESQATKLKEQVEEKWENYVDIILLHGV